MTRKFFFIFICFSIVYEIALASLPKVNTSNGIQYITGGIGSDESEAIIVEAKHWPILFMFSIVENGGRGIWVSNIRVIVSDSKNIPILDITCDGPLMLLKLMPGSYSVAANFDGVIQKRQFDVKQDASQRISIYWKSSLTREEENRSLNLSSAVSQGY